MSVPQWIVVLNVLLVLEVLAVYLAASWRVRRGELSWHDVAIILLAAALHPVLLLKVIFRRDR